MKKILLLAVAALASLGAFAQNYEHSAGVVVGNLNGLSYKHFISDELAIQADLGFGIVSTSGSSVLSEELTIKRYGAEVVGKEKVKLNIKASFWSFQIAPNFIWQKNIASMDWANLDFFVGGGISLGYAKVSKAEVVSGKGEEYEKISYNGYEEETKGDYEIEESFTLDKKSYPEDLGKFGINAMAGVEIAFTGAPITVGIDFRPGYGLLFAGHDDEYKKAKKEVEEQGGSYKASPFTYSFFDWTLAATVRYTF